MADRIGAVLEFHTRALGLRAQRQQLLASNIANADTPGYKARDIDFANALKGALAGTAPATNLARTSAAHLAGARETAGGAQVLYRTLTQPTLDGNSVDMDVERSQFAENAVHYEANLAFINAQLKSLLAAIQG